MSLPQLERSGLAELRSSLPTHTSHLKHLPQLEAASPALPPLHPGPCESLRSLTEVVVLPSTHYF